MHRTGITVNTTVLCTSELLGEWILKSFVTKKKSLHDVVGVFSYVTMVIIVQYMSDSNQCVVPLKLTQRYYMSIISPFKKK